MGNNIFDSSDIPAIVACQRGDLEKFGVLYEKYIKKIYDFIYFKTIHKETAEDLTSQTFLKALEKISSFDLNKGSFSAWLYQIARNNVIDYYRAKKADDNIEDVWDLSGDEDIERDAEARIKLAQVEKYLKGLKSEQREIIIMRIWQNMSYREIAAELGKSEAACKMSFLRAINTLRQEMPLALFLLFIFYSLF